MSKWTNHLNLRLKPAAPAKGRGRLQKAIRRAFLVSGPVLSLSQIFDWCYANQRKRRRRNWSVVRILQRHCDRVGRAKTIGRPILWRWRGDDLP